SLKTKGDLDGALHDYNVAVQLSPGDDIALYNRALLHVARNNYLSAIEDFRKYLSNGGGRRGGDQKRVQNMIRDLRKAIAQTKAIDDTDSKTLLQKKKSKNRNT